MKNKNDAVVEAAQSLVDYFAYHNKNLTKNQTSLVDDLREALKQSGSDSADGNALPSDPQTPTDWGRLFDAFGNRIRGADGLAAHIGWGVSDAGMEALYALRNSKCDHDGRIFALLEEINYHTESKDFVFNPRGDF